jgi:hypothetical protein
MTIKLILSAKGTMILSKAGITINSMKSTNILDNQMLYASRKSDIILCDMMDTISYIMKWKKDSVEYRYYKIVLTIVIDDMLDILRTFFKENHLYKKTDEDFRFLSDFMIRTARDKADLLFIPEIMGMEKEEMNERCGKEVKQVWENHGRDIFREAKKIATENKA